MAVDLMQAFLNPMIRQRGLISAVQGASEPRDDDVASSFQVRTPHSAL
jgi:hypothetical protein